MRPAGADATLSGRDAVLSRLSGTAWPHGPLLDLLGLSPGADLLDIGAGDGALLREWRRRGASGRVVGLDPRPGREVHRGVAEALPYMAGAFDVALLVRTLSHLSDADAALREARRVLRPGGRLVLAAHGADHLRASWHALGRPAEGPGPEDSLRAALARAGQLAVRLDLRRHVTVTAADARDLTHAYGLSLGVNERCFPVQDTLHLVVYLAAK